MLHLPYSLVGIEPFDAYIFRVAGWATLAVAGPSPAASQDLVYIPNVSASMSGTTALTTIEDQTSATLDRLGELLAEQGLDYSDVVVSNVFLKDSRHFQGMNDV